MGCDIHLQVQVRNEDGTWRFSPIKPFLTYGDPGFTWETDPTSRNYYLFGFLAGVRRNTVPGNVMPRRGLPPDYEPPETDKYGTVLDTFTGGDVLYPEDTHSTRWGTLEQVRNLPWDIFDRSHCRWGVIEVLRMSEEQILKMHPYEQKVIHHYRSQIRDGTLVEERVVLVPVDLRETMFYRWLYSDTMNQISDLVGVRRTCGSSSDSTTDDRGDENARTSSVWKVFVVWWDGVRPYRVDGDLPSRPYLSNLRGDGCPLQP